MFKKYFELVMDPDVNPLQRLPYAVRFQIMTQLAYMWSVVFCAMIGSFVLIGPSIALHTLFLVGLYFTKRVFDETHDRNEGYDELMSDENAELLYDDIWGAPEAS